MPKYTVVNKTSSLVILPISPSVKMAGHSRHEIVALASVMDDEAVAAMINKNLIEVTVANDPDTPDVLEVSPSTLIGGREVDVNSLPPVGEKVYASAAPVTGTVPRLDDGFGGFYYPVFVETPANGGDDSNEGTAASPVATLREALLRLPRVPHGFTSSWSYGDYGYVSVGPGTFDMECSYEGVLDEIYIFGDVDQETVTISGVAAVAGSATLVDVTTSGFTSTVAADGEYFLEIDYGSREFYSYGEAVVDTGTATPTIRLASNSTGFSSGTAYLVKHNTTFKNPSASAAAYIRLSEDPTVYFNRCKLDFSTYTGVTSFKMGGMRVRLCSLTCSDTHTAVLERRGERDVDIVGSYVKVGFLMRVDSTAYITGCHLAKGTPADSGVASYGPGSSLILDNVYTDAKFSVGTTTGGNGYLRARKIDYTGSKVLLTGAGNGTLMTLLDNITVSGAEAVAVVEQGARVFRSGGTGVGACTAVPVQVTDGAAMGVSGWAFTNSTTGGEEVKVGGLVVQTFASLPNADFTGAAATGSKAT